MVKKIKYIWKIIILTFLAGCGGTGSTAPEGFQVFDITVQVTETTANITFKTTLPAKVTLNYGIVDTSLNFSAYDTTEYSADHTADLLNLISDTTYFFRITAWTEGGQTVDSETNSFTTLAKTQNEPIISGLMISNITATSATISWYSDEISDSRVFYGLTAVYTDSVHSDSLVTQHQIILDSLQAQTQYFLQSASDDTAGYRGYSQDSTFTTGQYVILTLPDTVANLNATFQYPVHIAEASDLGGVEYMISYDTAFVAVTNVVEGPFYLTKNGDFFITEIDNLSGRVRNYVTWKPIFQGDLLIGTQADGNGIVAYIEFQTKAAGLTDMTFLPDSTFFLDMFIKEIAGSLNNGSILIQ